MKNASIARGIRIPAAGRRRQGVAPQPGTETTARNPDGAPLRTRLALSRESATALQRQAGNSAVVGLITGGGRVRARPRPRDRRSPTVQRDALTTADDPKGYTKPGGVQNVEKTGMTRVEVTGLKYGVAGGHQAQYKSWRGNLVPSSEKQMTKESPDNAAVVIMPDLLVANRPTQVVLHFHGWGFRAGDPFAGYAVATGELGGQGRKGQVRDVDQEHWAQQMGAVGKERAAKPDDAKSVAGPQIIAILAQGRGMSDFGDVPTFDYIADVFAKAGGNLAKITKYHVILSAHSGGGNMQVAKKVNAGDIVGTDPSRLRTGTPGKSDQRPSDLVILFDAEGAASTMSWIVGEIGKLTNAIKADPANAQATIVKAPKFRGYFATSGAYWRDYHDATTSLNAALRGVPAQWRRPDTSSPASIKVSDLFRIIEVKDAGVNHEHVISGGTTGPSEAGALADALRASVDPTIDRAREYDPAEGAPRLQKFEEALAKKAKAAKEAAEKKAAEKQAAEKQAAEKAAKEKAVQPSMVPGAPTSARPPGPLPTAAPTVQRDDPDKKPVPAPASNWRKSDATSEFKYTDEDKALLAGKTADARAADSALLPQSAIDRLNALAKAEKKNKLKPGEDKELADLRTLKDRVETTNRALKRKDVEEIIDEAGLGTVTAWYGDIKKGTFLGIELRCHKALADRLDRASTALVNDATVNPSKKNAKDLGVDLNMYASTSDLRQPAKAVGGGSLSMHTFGLAVDLNYKGNPFIGNAGDAAPTVIRRATSLVTGTASNVTTSLGDAQASYTALDAASDAMKTYFSYRDPANLAALTTAVQGHTAAKGEPTDLAGWQKQIEADYTALKDTGDFKKHKSPDEGFLDLNESVVMALVGAGLTWGGTYPGDKDIMHFDLRQGDGAKIQAARTAHVTSR